MVNFTTEACTAYCNKEPASTDQLLEWGENNPIEGGSSSGMSTVGTLFLVVAILIVIVLALGGVYYYKQK